MKLSFFFFLVVLKLLSLSGRATFAVRPLAPPYSHLNQRNASGHSDAQQKNIKRKQTQFMTDADKTYSTTKALPICGCPMQIAVPTIAHSIPNTHLVFVVELYFQDTEHDGGRGVEGTRRREKGEQASIHEERVECMVCVVWCGCCVWGAVCGVLCVGCCLWGVGGVSGCAWLCVWLCVGHAATQSRT